MMPTTEPTPPIRELPAEIEATIDELSQCAKNWGFATEAPGRKQMYKEARADLLHAIRAALDDEWDKGFRQAVTDHVELVENIKALRERCQRLRQAGIDGGFFIPGDDTRGIHGLEPGDLADDLRPRE